MDENGTSNAMKTIDDVQDCVDALVLSLFQAMQSTPETGAQATDAFVEKYNKALDTIDMLAGITKSRADLIAEVQEVDARYAVCKQQVLQLEHELTSLSDTVEKELRQVGYYLMHCWCDLRSLQELSDERLGLQDE